MKKANLQLETLTCPSCLQKIENSVKGLDGVNNDSVQVMFNSSKVKLDFDNDKIELDEIVKTIDNLGFKVEKANAR